MTTLNELGLIAKQFTEVTEAALRHHGQHETFMRQATLKEQTSLLSSRFRNAGPDFIGLFTVPTPQTAGHHLWIADIFAMIAERSGYSAGLAQCLPPEAREEKVIAALRDHAPALARLCEGSPAPRRALLN